MFLIYISNRYTNHQVDLCESFLHYFDKFYFVEIESNKNRVLPEGKCVKSTPDFVVPCEKINTIKDEITQADVVLVGSVPHDLIEPRLKKGLLTFKYSERICKKNIPWHKIPIRRIRYHFSYNRYSKYYLLCASAYSSYDFSLTNSFVNKTYKWGYFPKVNSFSIDQIMSHKHDNNKNIKLLWVGRLIDWKHPELAISVAEELRNRCLDFSLDIVGFGAMKDELQRIIIDRKLDKNVHLLGTLTSNDVHQLMLNSDIFLFTSDFNEGWGAVLNEAMSNGCAVVASHAIGAVPFMLNNGENGLIYKCGDNGSLISCVIQLMGSSEKRNFLGRNAISTIRKDWNAGEAARRFHMLSLSMISNQSPIYFSSGPCSKANILKNNWFK